MTEATVTLLEGLSDAQRTHAQLSFDDPRREVWMYWPREMTGDHYSGIGMHHLTFEQRKLVMRLVAIAVDPATLGQIAAIQALEVPLDAGEGYRQSRLRDPLRYWITVFGDPGGDGPWSWQFEGHHVVLTFVIAGGEVVATTPLFLGANPAVITKRGHVVTRPLGPEEDAARGLLASMAGDIREQAMLRAPAPIDIVLNRVSKVPPVSRPGERPHPLRAFNAAIESLGPEERDALTIDLRAPHGVPRRHLDARQRALLDDLVGIYVGRLPEALASAELARLENAGLDGICFAWAGSSEPGAPHYYRLHGSTLLVEYDCVQDGANHAHAVWRDPARDFGRDPLRAHLAAG